MPVRGLGSKFECVTPLPDFRLQPFAFSGQFGRVYRVRRPFTVLLTLSVLAAGLSAAAQPMSPETLLERGIRSFRAADHSSAIVDLQAAAQGFLSPEQMQEYVNTGRFDRLAQFETALVYLAISQFRAVREDDARETILRLVSAERISPTFAKLPLAADAAEFESLVKALVPSASLPRNIQLASADPSAPLPSVTPSTEPKVAVRKTIAQERAERQAAVDEFIRQERERIQHEADERIATERAATVKAADEKIAAEKAAAERAAAEQIAAAQREAEQRIAAAQSQANERVSELKETTDARVSSVQTEAEKRVAEAKAEAERRVREAEAAAQQRVATAEAEARQRTTAAEEEAKRQADVRVAAVEEETNARIEQARAESERTAAARMAEAEAAARRVYLTSLRQAEAFANNGLVEDANRIYNRLATSENVPREVVAEAAIGLYRTGAFRESVDAFRRMGTFARGEEDLRYYHAVALFEIGEYEGAQKELACALPFIQVTDDVARYRLKIEQTLAQQQAAKR
jgi:hypothetical protein